MTQITAKIAAASVALLPLLAPVAQAETSQSEGYNFSTPRVSTQSSGAGMKFTLGAGVSVSPEYPGSDDYTAGPDMVFRIHALQYGGLTYGNPDPYAEKSGLGVSGSFRYIGKRDSSDYDELAGLSDVDASLEMGLGLSYDTDYYKVYSDVRYGVIGHNTWVGEVGADLKLHPTERLTLTMGPRAFWGTERYAQTYYGVSAAEAAASAAAGGSLTAFDPDGGFLSAGVEFGAKYRFDGGWGVEGSVRYDKLMNDAKDSPITKAGSDEQWSMKFDVTRVFTLGAM
ncbi:MipA/OmpV family protein [Thioclava sp. GXIMD4216]|uniref:MipA/OmpV family protein n=1 Tax=Thioclava litoralis TaxID=3076557 RepID=A0ABZ1DYV9_9RHOB|nr:MipA/OmpV family protein [Thioclava sp. FTW29]